MKTNLMKGQSEHGTLSNTNVYRRLCEMRKVFDSIVQPGTAVYEQIHNASEDMDMWLGIINSVRVHA